MSNFNIGNFPQIQSDPRHEWIANCGKSNPNISEETMSGSILDSKDSVSIGQNQKEDCEVIHLLPSLDPSRPFSIPDNVAVHCPNHPEQSHYPNNFQFPQTSIH